jgi:hypothetical protein
VERKLWWVYIAAKRNRERDRVRNQYDESSGSYQLRHGKQRYLTLILLMCRIGWPNSIPIYSTICNATEFIYIWKLLLHVSGGTSTHHKERIQLYLQHLVFVTSLLLSAAIVEESEPVWVCCGWWWVEVPPETCRAVSWYK